MPDKKVSMLQETVQNLPDAPGVYQYFDNHGRLLYVGKAKSLKKRVKSYFRFTPTLGPAANLSMRITKMILETASLEYILVENENDSLILENSLIKQLKPKYNILLRDDKTYPYIYIDMDEDFPRFEITRKVIKGRAIKYYGPFATGGRDILDSLYDLFPLVQKKSCVKGKKACLFYQIKKCLPCEGKVTSQDYKTIVEEAAGYINNKSRLIAILKEKMMQYAENLQFEEAGKLKDRIEGIERSTIISGVDLAKNENFDVLAIADENDKASAVRLFIRDGKVVSSANTTLRFAFGFDRDEAYKRAFLAFYSPDMPITSTTIYTAHPFEEAHDIESFMHERFDRKFSITHPKIGKKLRIAELALKNAEELLKLRDKNETVLDELKELFNLETLPYRIECFDNSHIQGSNPVGAMVVFENGSFLKSDYRNYNLEATAEYEQMRELLTRRVESFGKNPPPDLWLIDGGETLRTLAKNILESVGIFIPVVAIAKEKLDAKAHRAKGAARDILYGDADIFNLKPTDRRLHLMQRIRDEAHSQAISFHRKQKLKSDKKISLLAIKGIGEAKMKRLIDYFGTFEAIEKANEEELSVVLNSTDVKKIRAFFES